MPLNDEPMERPTSDANSKTSSNAGPVEEAKPAVTPENPSGSIANLTPAPAPARVRVTDYGRYSRQRRRSFSLPSCDCREKLRGVNGRTLRFAGFALLWVGAIIAVIGFSTHTIVVCNPTAPI